MGLAVALSLAAAVALEKWQISEDGFEGVLMLVAAVFVVTMILWMNHVARHLRTHIERRVDALAAEIRSRGRIRTRHLRISHGGARRRGAGPDLARRRAVERRLGGVDRHRRRTCAWRLLSVFSSFRAHLKIPLGRFFAVTSAILIIVAVQLALTGLHELSEAQWLPSSKREMALVGPIVRNDVFFLRGDFRCGGLLVSSRMAGAPARHCGRASRKRR